MAEQTTEDTSRSTASTKWAGAAAAGLLAHLRY